MSRSSQEALDKARATAGSAQAGLEEAQAAFLDGVARQFESGVLPISKRIAKAQPAVARELGPEGLAHLMERARAYVRQLATKVRASPDNVKWGAESTFDPFSDANASQAVFPAVYPHLEGLAKVYEASGFNAGRDNREGAQSLIQVHELFSTEVLGVQIDRVRAAILALQQANRTLLDAEKVHDDEDIEDLFEGI